MLDGFELNSVELDAGSILPFDGEGAASANASSTGVGFAYRRPTGLAIGIATFSGTAYPIRPSYGNALSFASVISIVSNAIRKAGSSAYAPASATGFLEAVVPASGYAIATALLVGIPSDEVGSGNAAASATLVSNGNRVQFDSGELASIATALNSGFDVVRGAASDAVVSAIASGEPAVGVKKDASSSIFCSAVVSGDAHIDSLLDGSGYISATASGYADIWFTSGGHVTGEALLNADATLLAKGESDINAAAILSDGGVRIANTGGNANSKANTFVKSSVNRKARSSITAKATAIGAIKRIARSRASAFCSATAVNDFSPALRVSSSNIVASATAVATAYANSHDLAPQERTVFIRSQGVRIVDVGQENRTIRVLA